LSFLGIGSPGCCFYDIAALIAGNVGKKAVAALGNVSGGRMSIAVFDEKPA
jgi:hypothetical protein